MEVHKNVREYALVGFLLLSVLFGMNLMAFIFGNLGPASAGIPITSPGLQCVFKCTESISYSY